MKKKVYLIIAIFMIGLSFILFFNTEVNAADSEGNFVIVLDPGHGGGDPGASNSTYGLQEAKVNYEIAQAAKTELEKYSGVKVYLTRYSDCPTVRERADFAKNYNADVMISIHINSGSSSARGAEVWVTQDDTQVEYYKKSKEVGEKILSELQNLGIHNRGVSTRSGRANECYPSGVVKDYYGIIRYSMDYNIRSILVEHCYISNGSDCQFINSSDKLKQIGIADAVAIAKSYQLTKKESGSVNVKSISLANPEITLQISSSDPQPLGILNILFNPTYASNKGFEIYSSNPDVVRVWQERVRGLKVGSSTLTIISNNNQRMVKINVNVTNTSTPLQTFTLDKTKIVLGLDEKNTIKTIFNPYNFNDKQVYWVSSNPEVARVWGGDIRGLKEGTSIITAITRTGTKTATCEVKVKPANYVGLQSITLDRTKLTLRINDKSRLSVVYNPSNATIQSSTWKSSDPSIVRVWNGEIRGLKEGTSTITATSEDEEKTATCEVTVKGVTEMIFEDIEEGTWYYEAVKYAYEKGLIKGYNDIKFAPFDFLTRGQLVTILWRKDGQKSQADIENVFLDVGENLYYTDAIKWANANQIVTGYGETQKFGPDDLITRQDLVLILNRYAKYKGESETGETELTSFIDFETISGYAEKAVKWAVQNEIITGNSLSDGTKTIAPQANATRAEVVVMLKRYIDRFN